MKKFTTDLVKQFQYNPNTGKFGSPKIIISEELPSSIMYHEGWLYVTGRGTVGAGDKELRERNEPLIPMSPGVFARLSHRDFAAFTTIRFRV